MNQLQYHTFTLLIVSMKKLYIFYQTSYLDPCGRYQTEFNHVMIVCAKTMKTLKHLNLADDDLFLRDGIHNQSYSRNQIVRCKLLKLFHYKTDSKLFIQIDFNSITEEVLVFDMRNENFYVKKNFLQLKKNINHGHKINIASKGDEIYGILKMWRYDFDNDQGPENFGSHNEAESDNSLRIWDEIRKFKFADETLVETGINLKSSERKLHEDRYWPSCKISTVFVQNVKLN